jgi:hypothetical protein
MSLQNLPPENLQEQPTPAADTLTELEKSYSRRLFDYAWGETRGEQTVGVIASVVGTILTALIVGSIWGGITAGVVAGILTFIATSILIFVFHFARAPKVLDTQLREQLKGAKQPAQGDEKDTRKREYKIERLKELIKQESELPSGIIEWGDPRWFMGGEYTKRAKRFLAEYFDDSEVKRFEKEGVIVLEKLLKDLLES